MAISTKNKRKITVGENAFYWTTRSKQQSTVLRLTVMTEDKTHSRLICDFKCKNMYLYWGDADANIYVLTPSIIRDTIEIAKETGWKPSEKGKDFVLINIEHEIDINFWTESAPETRRSKIENLKSKIV